ncbi:hypothetical protein N0V86_006362 [Didymella sp. IMI 355093]|nr:hypothetical protein N0V86_006362 [Didymella sp. IMI 355093]
MVYPVAQEQDGSNQFRNDMQVNDIYLNEANADAQALLDLYNTTGYNQHTIPAFFEQIMVPAPDFMGVDYLQPPPDLAAWMPEVDWLGTGDIFGNDFTPAIDQMLEVQVSQRDNIRSERQPPAKDTSHEKIDSDSARRRHAAFKQSACEHENIMLDESNVDLAASPHMPYSSNIVIPDQLSAAARDRIFQLVSKTARSQITIPAFPSADCVDKLIKVGIAKRTETDAWIHPYLFESETARPEYLTALVAAGCVCFGIPAVSKTGLALQEIVRVALNNLSENDNSVVRDLEYLQACMLWLDIGAFCGYRRKMEIAESSLQSLVTALRRAGRLDYVRYPTVTPFAEDNEEELHAKWKQYQCLQREDFLPGRSPAVTSVFHQFLQMFLYVNLDTITRFAGKCGETAANSAYIHLSPWSQTKEARIAVCHAGQVLRAARHIPPYQIRGPDSFMIYHAIMVLWTYSMMVRDRAKKTGTTTPMRIQPSSPPSKIVYLDDAVSDNQRDIDAFILRNEGIPCLHIISMHRAVATESNRPELCNLKYPSQVMKTGVRLLDASHPEVDREIGPPLMRALCGLMEELGGLR